MYTRNVWVIMWGTISVSYTHLDVYKRQILNSFEIEADTEQLKLVLNLTLLIVITCRALPENLPLLVSEASDGTAEFQMEALVDYLEKLKCKPIL